MTVLAHAIQIAQQRAEIELLMVAGVLAVAAAYLFWRSGESLLSFTTLGLALVALVAAFVLAPVTELPPIVPSSDPLLSIMKPEAGTSLPADEEVEVAVRLENASLSDGGVLELLLDGRTRETSTLPRFRVRLSPGEHRLTVRYVPGATSNAQTIESSVIVRAE